MVHVTGGKTMSKRVSKALTHNFAHVLIIASLGILSYHSSFVMTVVAQDRGENRRSDAWKEVLDRREFVKADEKSVLIDSLSRTSGCSVHMVYDPKRHIAMTYTFNYRGKDVVTLDGHLRSSFATSDKVLYFAQYPPSSTGCTVVAFDLESGKKLWGVGLHHQKPKGHSGYANIVSLRLSNAGEIAEGKAGAAVIITGSESYCDYVEVLDSETGESLAIKEYRVGF